MPPDDAEPAWTEPAGRAERLAAAAAARRAEDWAAAEALYRGVIAAGDRDAEAQLGLGHCLLRRGEADAAAAAFAAAAGADPANPWPSVYQGDALLRLGRQAEAAAAYRRAATGPARTDALLGLGHAAQQAGDAAASLAHYQDAADGAGENRWPHVYVGDALRRLGRGEDAAAAYRRAGAEGPTRARVLLGLGHCALDRGDAEGAAAQFAAAAETDPADPWPALHLGQALQRLGRRDAAAALIARAAELDPALLPARLALAESLADGGETERALALLQDALGRHPREATVVIALALLQRRAGQAEAAAATLRALLAEAPAQIDARIELALLELHLGRPAEAAARLEGVLADAPANCRALEQLAEMARMARDQKRAQALLLRAIAAEPANPWPRIGLSQALADLGRHAEALAALDEAAARLAPDDAGRASVAARRVELLRRAGHWPAARALARSARSAWPRDFPLWVQAALTELQTGGPAALAAALADAPVHGAVERARWLHLRGQAAEAAWDLDAAAAGYAAALALTPDDAWVHMDLARADMLRLEVPASRAHLRTMARLQAGPARLEGRSPNVSQTHYGQILDEYELEPAGMAALAALRERPAPERVAPLLALLRALPGFTPAAVALLVTLRQGGALATAAPGAGPIPRRIAHFWDAPAPPEDVAALMQSWAEHNPDHAIARFDDAAAQAFLADAFAPDVLAAYQRARQPAMQADLFRLAWLFARGGWYVDADDRCLAPLDRIAPAGAALVVYQEDLGTLANDVIGAVPQHPLLGRALDLAVAAVLRGDEDVLWLSTGPGLLTRAFATMLAGSRLGWREWLATVAVLDRFALFHGVAVHCLAGYKALGRHWSSARRRETPGTV